LIENAIDRSGHASAIHRTGFLQAMDVSRLYAHAAAFVHPSLSEPWGLVVNEAAATGLPLLVSRRAGCALTLLPEPEGTTGARFDPLDVEELTQKLGWMTLLSPEDRRAMGARAAETVSRWGPDRFAQGTIEALEMSLRPRARCSLTLEKVG
jgi:glycosyltransferase involved in cell wall biosynthesis